MKKSDRELCSLYRFKHIIEEFTDLFEDQHVYISTESAVEALMELGYKVVENVIFATWNYPNQDTLVSIFGNSKFESHFERDPNKIPFYKIPSIRVSAMIEAHSSAYKISGKGKEEFPLFEKKIYDDLKWIDVPDGVLSYCIANNTITLDAIFSKSRRNGTGRKLFQLFLDEVSRYPDNFFIEIDAYTKDSKMFFQALSSENNFFEPSRTLTKADTYSIGLAEFKKS